MLSRNPDPDVLSMFIIYDRPADFPTGYVVRRHDVANGETWATTHAVTASSLTEARLHVPPDCVRFDRDPNGEGPVVETWL